MCSEVTETGKTTREKRNWWTNQTISWYIRAARYTDFHEKLATRIAFNLEPGETILEVGCGLGYIAKKLTDKGYDIEGIDIDKTVIDSGKKIHGPKCRLSVDSYKTTDKRADVVLAVFCGRVDKQGLGAFERLASDKIIYIISKHKNNSLKEDKTQKVVEYLEKSGYRYWLDEFSLRFDQPFTSREEAAQFFEAKYGNEGPELKSTSGVFPFIYENEKELSLFVIEKQKQC